MSNPPPSQPPTKTTSPTVQDTFPQIIKLSHSPEPVRRCFRWRDEYSHTPLYLETTVCWTKLKANAANFKPPPGYDLPIKPFYDEEKASEPETNLVNLDTNPDEIGFLKGRMLRVERTINVANDASGGLYTETFADGSFKKFHNGCKGAQVEETLLGLNVSYRSGTMYLVPIGLVPHRLYKYIAYHVNRLTEPPARLISQSLQLAMSKDVYRLWLENGKKSHETMRNVWQKRSELDEERKKNLIEEERRKEFMKTLESTRKAATPTEITSNKAKPSQEDRRVEAGKVEIERKGDRTRGEVKEKSNSDAPPSESRKKERRPDGDP